MNGNESERTRHLPEGDPASRPTVPLPEQTVPLDRARPVTFPYAIGDPILPGYRLVKPLGRGGFGEVWQADAPGGMSVAIKVLANVGRREGAREYRALQTIKNIRHAHMVPVFGVWLKSGDGACLGEADVAEAARRILGGATADAQTPLELIVAMGLGDGTLHDRLQEALRAGEAGLPPEALLDWMRQAALALDHFNAGARAVGGGAAAVQHCDIKPQNILLVGDVVQVCDFGLARAQGEVRATSNNMASLAYAPPEMVTPPYDPSPTTDQYSLAISYHELRTGRLPNRDTTVVGVLNEKLSGRLDLDSVGAAERRVLERALDRDPARRWPSCSAFVRALAAAVGPLGQTAAAPVASAAASKSTDRTPVETAKIAAASPAGSKTPAGRAAWGRAVGVAAGAILLVAALSTGLLRAPPPRSDSTGKQGESAREVTNDGDSPAPETAAAVRARGKALEETGDRVAAAAAYATVPGMPADELARILWDLHNDAVDAGRPADTIPILVRLEGLYAGADVPQVPDLGRWDVVNSLAWYLATVPEGSDPRRARSLAEEALALAAEDPPKRAQALDTLAAALARDGDLDAAVARVEEAIGLVGKGEGDLEKHLEAYRSGVPWTTP